MFNYLINNNNLLFIVQWAVNVTGSDWHSRKLFE